MTQIQPDHSQSSPIITDDVINGLFAGTNFGAHINGCVKAKRALIAKTLKNQMQGYWSGHTAYHIVVNGGFLVDSKRGTEKKLTPLGEAFLQEFTL